MARTLTLNSDTPRPDFENGAVGTQNDARLAMYDQIADYNESAKADEFEDVTDDMYANPAGTGGEDSDAESASDRLDVQDSGVDDESVADSRTDDDDRASLPRLKVNGQDVEITPELIAHAQKIAAADEYLAQASRLYKSASTANEPSQDAPEVDDAALARAIQMGTEDEAIAAIQKLRTSLPQGEIEAIVERKLASRDTQTDADRFKSTYKDLMANSDAREAVWAFDTLYANDGEAPTYERFEKAAKQVMKLRGDTSGLEEKAERKAQARRPVIGQSARPAPPPPEREENVRDVIAEMARSRGQMQVRAGD